MQVIREILSTVALATVSLVSINVEIPDDNLSETKKHVNAVVASHTVQEAFNPLEPY